MPGWVTSGQYDLSLCCTPHAEVAELVDALASGASGGNPVEVQVLFSAPRWPSKAHVSHP